MVRTTIGTGEEVGSIADETATQGVAHGYADAWRHGDRAGALDLIDPGATVEWNLPRPAGVPALLSTLTQLVAGCLEVQLAEETYAGYRAALVYDCSTLDGPIRIVEFLAVADGRIQEIRQVYDLTALRRLIPGLLD